MKDQHGLELNEGDLVNCYPDPDNVATQQFTGTIQKFRLSGGEVLATVKDQDDNCFDFESHELELCLDC